LDKKKLIACSEVHVVTGGRLNSGNRYAIAAHAYYLPDTLIVGRSRNIVKRGRSGISLK